MDVEADFGATEDQINDWNIHNDHADDEPQGALGFPCHACDAAAGEPCRPDCEYAEADEAQTALDDEPLMTQAQQALMASVYRLPYCGLLDDPPDRRDDAEDVWLAKLAIWMGDYHKLITDKVAELEAGNRRAIALQFERDTVRGFLTGTGVEVPA